MIVHAKNFHSNKLRIKFELEAALSFEVPVIVLGSDQSAKSLESTRSGSPCDGINDYF